MSHPLYGKGLSYPKALKALASQTVLVLSMIALYSPALSAKEEKLTEKDSVLTVTYARTSDEYFSQQEKYYRELIHLALEKSGQAYEIKSVLLDPHTETRSIKLLNRGVYNIHWLNTSNFLEENLSPIRIPLYKGLIGWKIPLIHTTMVDEFLAVKSLSQLKQYSVLHGTDWADTPLLENNGFKVISAIEFRSLSRMLVRKRGDFFPRAVIEIWDQLAAVDNENIEANKSIVIQFPAAYYFFVPRNQVRLHKAIETGLNRAVKDGSFDKVFFKYFTDHIRRSKLDKRLIFKLKNPALPKATPLHRKELWFSEAEAAKLSP